jgi:hypothetical protein
VKLPIIHQLDPAVLKSVERQAELSRYEGVNGARWIGLGLIVVGVGLLAIAARLAQVTTSLKEKR